MVSSRVVRRCLVMAVFSTLVAALMLLNAQAQTEKGKKYALLIGITEYDHASLPALKYTENDVDEMEETLKSAGFRSVRVLTVSRGKKNAEDNPTTSNIQTALNDLFSKPTRHDTVLIALAGHGVTLEVQDPDEKKPSKTYSFFCPSDAHFREVSFSSGKAAKLILMPALMKDLGGCGAGTKLILVDACRNELKADSSTRSFSTGDMLLPKGMAALFSCKPDERAWETKKLGKAGHGVFFHFVLEGLRGKAINEKNEIRWSRLAEYVTDRVSEEVPKIIGGGANQTPHGGTNFVGSSPVLVSAVASGERTMDKPKRTEVVKDWGKEIQNSIGMKLVRIPAGTFKMGSPAGEADRSQSEKQHEVEITKPFWLGVHEVTQKEFKAVMGYNPSYFARDGEGKTGVTYLDYSKPAGGKDKAPADTSQYPVENVSYEEAEEFCKKLTVKEANGRVYRLPTEAEWEYACRGGATSYQTFHFGDSLSSSQANFNGNYPYGGAAKGAYLARTSKVGSYAKNGFGLYDMHGNVWEWCSDWYDKDYYSKSPHRDPAGPSKGSDRVIRGGSWSNGGRDCRSAYRYRYAPAIRLRDLGFRVALAASRHGVD